MSSVTFSGTPLQQSPIESPIFDSATMSTPADIPIPDDIPLGQIYNREEALDQENTFLEQSFFDLQAQVQVLLAQQAARTSTESGIRAERKKAPDPTPFSGKHGTLESFLLLCEMKFDAEPRTYSTDEDKILYAGLNLRETALAWYGPFRKPKNKSVEAFKSWDDFCTRIREAYGSQDPKKTAISEIKKLRQTGSVLEYTSDFQRLAAELEWPDSALLSTYQDGLSRRIKNHLFYMDEDNLSTLSSVIRVAQQFERKSRDLHLQNFPPRFQSTYTPTRKETRVINEASTVNNGLIPMDLDGTSSFPRGPLSDDEKERRRNANLCLYCGRPGHKVSECPGKQRSGKAPTRSLTVRNTSSN